MFDDLEVEYPAIDRSDFTPNFHKKNSDDQLDLSWGDGVLKNGRPFRVECWCANQITYLTYFMPTVGIENLTNVELKQTLISEGLVEFDDEKFLSSGFSGNNLSAIKKVDPSGTELWEISIIVGDEDGTYVRDRFSLKRYGSM